MNIQHGLLTPPPSPTTFDSTSAHINTSNKRTVRPEDRIGWILGNWLKLTAIQGVGAYGVVYRALDLRNNTPLAVKALPKAEDARQRQFQRREIELHHAASQHPNVVTLYRRMETEDTIFVVLELCAGGDLFSNITERRLYQDNEFLIKRAFLQICDAVQYCHSLGIYHRDLKPENILVSADGWDVKLADFGLATRDHTSDDIGCGSTFYMSPECHYAYSERYATGPNDIWSLGIVLVNLTCGRNPWKRASLEDSTYRTYLKNPNFLQQILPITPELNMILARIFDPEPWRRITVPELMMLVATCPSFTKRQPEYTRPITPPAETFQSPFNTTPEVCAPKAAPFFAMYDQDAASSSDEDLSDSGSVFSDASECSSVSSHGSYGTKPEPQMVVCPPRPSPIFNVCTSMLQCVGAALPQQCMVQVPALC